MHRIRRILVAVKDPHARAQPAVAKGAQLAEAFGARLELFHRVTAPIHVDPSLAPGIDLDALQREQCAVIATRLERIAARIHNDAISVTTHTEWGYPIHEAIVRRARKIRADLIVAERHAGKRHAKWLLRFTDWELLRLADCPVLVVKTGRPYHKPTILAAIDPGHAHAKPTRLDDGILRAAVALQSRLRGELHAMHVFQPTPILAAESASGGFEIAAQLEQDAEDAAQKRFVHALRGQSVPPRNRHLVLGQPIDAIPATARATRAAVVVMGAISRSGIRRLFIGNTAEQVLDELPCDVLVIKPARPARRTARRSP